MSDSLQALEFMAAREVAQQAAAARAYPRNVAKFVDDATRIVTMGDGAGEYIYVVPKRNEAGALEGLEGPSSRFAEVLAFTFTNCHVRTRVADVDPADTMVAAQAVFVDLESNTARSCEVRRAITFRSGHRFSDPVVAATANAAASIAARNVVLQSIPRALWEPIYAAARASYMGAGEAFVLRRARVFEELERMGATASVVLASLGVATVDEVTGEQLLQLRGITAAIREGDASVAEVFAKPAVATNGTPEARGGVASAKAVLEQQRAANAELREKMKAGQP